jgi:hypothetical protein
MIQLSTPFHGKTCARCRHVIQSDPAWTEDRWYQRLCLDEGTRAVARAGPRGALRLCGGGVPCLRSASSRKRQRPERLMVMTVLS